jgi:hypothetical protein
MNHLSLRDLLSQAAAATASPHVEVVIAPLAGYEGKKAVQPHTQFKTAALNRSATLKPLGHPSGCL